MNFNKSRPLLLMGAALFATVALAASSASAQQKASQASADCVLGAGIDCQDTFNASSAAKGTAPGQESTAKYDAYVEKKEKEQVVLSRALTQAADQGKEGILKACKAVSPNKPTDACP